MPEEKSKPSIIQAIQKMIKAGESDEKILENLLSLGVEKEQAHKLLLLAEADTFSLLESDINSLIKQEMNKNLPALNNIIEKLSKRSHEDVKKEVNQAFASEKEGMQKELNKSFEKFSGEIRQDVMGLKGYNKDLQKEFGLLGGRMQKLELDFEEAKIGGLGKRNKHLSLTLVIMGIVFSLTSLYSFFIIFQSQLAIDSVIITVMIAIIGVIMFFISSLV